MSDRVVEVGSRVKLVADGVSTFTVTEIIDDRTATVVSELQAPGAYPFNTPLATLILVDADEPKLGG
jgi:hypothetical protein